MAQPRQVNDRICSGLLDAEAESQREKRVCSPEIEPHCVSQSVKEEELQKGTWESLTLGLYNNNSNTKLMKYHF